MVRGESKVTALLLALAVGFVGGMAVCFQGPLASLMSQKIGSLESAFVIHLGGTVVAGMLLLFVSGGGLPQWRSVPWYALASGVLGLFLIFALSYTIPRVGVTGTYAVGGQNIYVNLRLISLGSGQILSAVDYLVPIDRDTRRMTLPGGQAI